MFVAHVLRREERRLREGNAIVNFFGDGSLNPDRMMNRPKGSRSR